MMQEEKESGRAFEGEEKNKKRALSQSRQEVECLKRYGDIINLPHHTSDKHPRMAAIDRAAQFSPFAALTGYEAALQETLEQAVSRVEQEVESEAFLEDGDNF